MSKNQQLKQSVALWLAHFTRTHGQLLHDHDMFPEWELKIGPFHIFTQSDWQGFNAYVQIMLWGHVWPYDIPD